MCCRSPGKADSSGNSTPPGEGEENVKWWIFCVRAHEKIGAVWEFIMTAGIRAPLRERVTPNAGNGRGQMKELKGGEEKFWS